MKRYGNLYAQICDINNLRLAAQNAASGKRRRSEVTAFFARLEENLEQLHRELTEKRYKTSPYDVFVKFEGKRREIYKLPFRDPLAGSQPAAVCFCLMGGETDGAGSPEAKWAQPAAWRL